MRECTDRNASACGTRGRQTNVITPQGKIQTGKTVWKIRETIQEPGQMARQEAGSSQQTLFHHARSIKRSSESFTEVMSAKKPRRLETNKEQLAETVQEKSVTIQKPEQMARQEAGGSQQTLSHHARTVKKSSESFTEVVSARKPERLETDRKPWIKEFEEQVDTAVKKLHEERKRTPSDLLFCLKIIETVNVLKKWIKENYVNLINTDYRRCKQYWMSETLPLYDDVLGSAVKTLRDRIASGGNWACFSELLRITQYLNDISFKDERCREVMLRDIWQEYVHGEFSYLEYLKNIPDNEHSVKLTSRNIDWLLSCDCSPVLHFDFIPADEIENLKRKATRMCHEATHSDMDSSDAGPKKEDPGKSRKMVACGNKATDMLAKRVQYDQCFMQFEQCRKEFGNFSRREGKDKSVMVQCNGFLEKLSKLRDELNKLVGNHYTLLQQKLEREIQRTVNKIQTEIRTRIGDDQPKAKALELINHLEENGYLNKQCGNSYSDSTNLQDMVKHPAHVNDMTNTQYNEFIDNIYFGINTFDSFAVIAGKLKKLHQCKHNIETVDKRGRLQKRIDNVKKILYKEYFLPVINAYHNAVKARKSSQEIATTIRKYKNIFIESIGNEFILNQDKQKFWKHLACLVWINDTDELSKKSSFDEGDVDNLLYLKELIPDPLKNKHINCSFQRALAKMFLSVRPGNPDAVPTEKIMKLSEWVKGMERHEGTRMLHDANSVLRRTWQIHARAMNQKAGASSDTPTGMMPSFTLGASLPSF